MTASSSTGTPSRPWIPPPPSASLDRALEEVSCRVREHGPPSPIDTGSSWPPTRTTSNPLLKCPKAAPLTLRALTLTESSRSPWEKANESSGQREARSSQAFSTVKQSCRGCTYWVPDADVSHCMRCAASFTWTRRKHHCRFCGRVFCDACSRHRLAVPARLAEEGYRPERACGACVQAQAKKRQYRCNGSCGSVRQYCVVDALLSHLMLAHRDSALPHLQDMRSAAAPARSSAGGSPLRDAASPTQAYTLMQAFLQWAMARQRLRKTLQEAAQTAVAEVEMTQPTSAPAVVPPDPVG